MSYLIIIDDVIANKGWLSGSYVRDVLIRKDPNYVVKDIDVLIPFSLHQYLIKTLVQKYKLVEVVVDYNKSEKIAHTHLLFDDITFDIFSSEDYEYLTAPDFDVNTLCWTGTRYTIWYPVRDTDEQVHGYSFDVNSIMQRAMVKNAVGMIGEWREEDKYELSKRYMKLASKGWIILNDTILQEYFST